MSNTKKNQILLDYLNANLAHEFRTPFAAINVSLNSLKKVFPVLLESHIKSCEVGLVDVVYKKDFLDILDKSIKNSLNEIKFCEFYLNKLLLLIKDMSIRNSSPEKINLKDSLEQAISLVLFRESYCFYFISNITFEIEINKKEFESCVQIFLEELLACKNEQQTKVIKVHIDEINMELSFHIVKSKDNSYISESIKKFSQGEFHHRYGVGFYLLNQLINLNYGKMDMIESSDEIRFVISFRGVNGIY